MIQQAGGSRVHERWAHLRFSVIDPVSPASAAAEPTPATPASTIPPLLARLLDRQTAAGLPPAYLPKNEQGDDT